MMSANPLFAVLPHAQLVAPASVTASGVSSSQINLAWSGMSGAVSYRVSEWVGGSWRQIGAFGSAATGASVTGLSANTAYYFDVFADSPTGKTWDNVVEAATRAAALAAPSVTATAGSSSQINLAWKSVAGANGYLVDELVGGVWKQIGSYASGVTGASVTGLNANTSYSFEVAAYNSAANAWSSAVSATTQSAAVNTVDHPTAAAAYAAVSGSLFGANGPVFTDVHQGAEGDCWLLASLAEVAARDPNDIRNMFTADGTAVENGATVNLYKVRFFNNSGQAVTVTVDTELPASGSYYDHVTGGVLWVALAEKAYAEANGAGLVTTQYSRSDSYDALNGGDPSWALRAITGQSASDFSINPANIAAAWNAGKLIVLGSSSNAGDNLVVGDSQGTHAYAVVNYNASSGAQFELYNPWGLSGMVNYNGHQVYGGAFNVNAAAISQDFAAQCIGAGAAISADVGAGSLQIAVASTLDDSAPTAPVQYHDQADCSSASVAATMPATAVQPQSPHAVDALFAAFHDDGGSAILDFRTSSALEIDFALIAA